MPPAQKCPGGFTLPALTLSPRRCYNAAMKRIIDFIRSPRLRELFIYGVVGVLTTVINYAVYAGGTRGIGALLHIRPDHAMLILIMKIIAWAASVAFAFWANKKYVFLSADWSAAALKREVPGFISARVLSLAFDAAFVEIAVHAFGMNDLIATLIANVIVIVLNYFASKFLIFKKK